MIRKIVRGLRPSRAMFDKMMIALGVVAVGVLGYFFGRGMPRSSAQVRDILKNANTVSAPSDSSQRVVAYVHENIPITREELGEYLINRYGAEKLDTLIRNRIIELACKGRNISVTDAEIDAQFEHELSKVKLSVKDFTQVFLKPKNLTMSEWKQDVLKMKLIMARFVEPELKVTDDDLRKGFEGRYGPKVECRWIVLRDDKHNGQIWERVRSSEAEFARAARELQTIPELAQVGGKAPPIHKHFGDENVEKIAFGLKPGEVSPLIGMPDKSVVILKCDKHIPEDKTKRFEEERVRLYEEIRQLKLGQLVTDKVADLYKVANPRNLLKTETPQRHLEQSVRSELNQQPRPAPKLEVPPVPKAGS